MPVWLAKTLVELWAKELGMPGFKKWDSPLEALFFQEAESRINGLTAQHPIGRYRVDFAVPDEMIAIEIDGREFHRANIDQIVKDRERQREIEAQGWTVVRFTGSEVYQSPERCICEVRRLIWLNQLKQNRKFT